MRLFALLLLPSVAAADPAPRASEGTVEIGAGPATFITAADDATTPDLGLAFHISIGDYMRPDLVACLEIADTAIVHTNTNTPGHPQRELDNSLITAVGVQLWVRRDLFIGGAAGLSYGSTPGAISDGETSGFAALARAGVALSRSDTSALTLSLLVSHTWLSSISGSLTSVGALLSYQFL